jgi:hypothetical protein
MEAIISAREFMDSCPSNMKPSQMMVLFVKLHREAILKEIAEDYTYYLKGDEGSETLDKEKFFKEVYPINNIK